MDSLGYVILVLVILIVIFLICRELNCWYFKINERRDLLSAIYNKLSSGSTTNDSNDAKEILRILNNINSKLSDLSENTKKMVFTENNSEHKEQGDSSINNTSNESVSGQSNSDETKRDYSFIHSHGRLYATKDSKLYCPHCYAFIESELFSTCPNCGKSLME